MERQPVMLILRYLAFVLFFLCAALLCVMLAYRINRSPGLALESVSPAGNALSRRICFVLDAGHGGMDGGASGAGGEVEKEINLAVAARLADLSEVMGMNAVMTREEDVMLSDGGTGSRKMQDLRFRMQLGEAYPDAFFISIHCNKFPDARYSGLQVYYSPNDGRSRALASAVQEGARAYLDAENSREIKEAGSNIYLMYHIATPAVLVECGFLSNEAEAALLCGADYQQRLAAVILSAAAGQRNA